jgi:hypothetical protein
MTTTKSMQYSEAHGKWMVTITRTGPQGSECKYYYFAMQFQAERFLKSAR